MDTINEFRLYRCFALEGSRRGMDRKTISELAGKHGMRITPATWKLTDQYLDRLIEEYKNE